MGPFYSSHRMNGNENIPSPSNSCTVTSMFKGRLQASPFAKGQFHKDRTQGHQRSTTDFTRRLRQMPSIQLFNASTGWGGQPLSFLMATGSFMKQQGIKVEKWVHFSSSLRSFCSAFHFQVTFDTAAFSCHVLFSYTLGLEPTDCFKATLHRLKIA